MKTEKRRQGIKLFFAKLKGGKRKRSGEKPSRGVELCKYEDRGGGEDLREEEGRRELSSANTVPKGVGRREVGWLAGSPPSSPPSVRGDEKLFASFLHLSSFLLSRRPLCLPRGNWRWLHRTTDHFPLLCEKERESEEKNAC